MDRREALTKLGAAGAIVAGGSMVLSSNNVAFAASGECLLAGVPSSIDMTMSLTPNEQELTVTPTLPTPPSGVTITYVWSGAGAAGSTTGPVTIQGSSTAASVVLVRPSAKSRKWILGDEFTVTLQVTWSCAGLIPNVGTYVLVSTLTATPYTVAVSAS